MATRYEDYDQEGPEQTKPDHESGKFITKIQDDQDNIFEAEIDYSYNEFQGDKYNFEATVKPIGPYTMTVESMKESAKYAIYDEIGYSPDLKDIIIFKPQSNG